MNGQASRTVSCAWSHSSRRISSSTPTAQSKPTNSTISSSASPATFKYKGPNLTGCYAGTGASTSFTLTSGDSLTFDEPYSYITIGSELQKFNFSCAEWFAPGVRVHWKLVKSFAQSPACASYAREIQDIRSVQATESSEIPIPILAEAVENGDAHTPFECYGGCEIYVPKIQVLYWFTSSQIACSQPNATMTSDAILLFSSIEIRRPTDSSQSHFATYTVLDGSTLTFPSTYLVIRGAISVPDRCAHIGKITSTPQLPYLKVDFQHSHSVVLMLRLPEWSPKQAHSIRLRVILIV